jgi:ATP adenylyltransferase
LFPYTSGHLLVVANRHIAFLSDANPEELQEIILLSQQCERALRQEYTPQGFNLGFNLGRAAGPGWNTIFICMYASLDRFKLCFRSG